MKIRVPIFGGSKIDPLFVKANHKLILKHKVSFNNLSDSISKIKLLESLWKTEYKATLVNSDESAAMWDHIEFEKEIDLFEFKIKWS
jgi:hypothetical protein